MGKRRCEAFMGSDRAHFSREAVPRRAHVEPCNTLGHIESAPTTIDVRLVGARNDRGVLADKHPIKHASPCIGPTDDHLASDQDRKAHVKQKRADSYVVLRVKIEAVGLVEEHGAVTGPKQLDIAAKRSGGAEHDTCFRRFTTASFTRVRPQTF